MTSACVHVWNMIANGVQTKKQFCYLQSQATTNLLEFMLKSKKKTRVSFGSISITATCVCLIWCISVCDAVGCDGQPQRFTANRLAAVFGLSQLDMGSGGFQKPWSWAVSIQMAIIVWGPHMSLNKETQTMFLTGNRLFTENKWAWRCVTTQFSRQIGYELSCPRWRQVRRPISRIGFI